MESIECISWNEKPLCYIVRSQFTPKESTFFTPPDANLQAGYIVHPAGHEIARHVHCPIERRIVGTCEVLLVRTGQCEIDIYNDDQGKVDSRQLRAGDIMIMVGGGHGFRMTEDTVLLEVKQGPYPGVREKAQF
jgi:hypothetical protein